MNIKCVLLIMLTMTFNCSAQSLTEFKANNTLFHYSGRMEKQQNEAIGLISSGAYVEFNVQGDSVNLYLQSESKTRNYFVVTINGEYQKRYKTESESIQKIPLKLPDSNQNTIGIYKATEAFNDKIIFHGIKAEALLPFKEKTLKIEFIGDSVTCGALADNSDIKCNEGEYQDQHNAYLTYGPRIAKTLDADFILNSVSGIGIYRNWNDENIDEPIMPQVYDNFYLNTDSSKLYDHVFQPQITSICLGTNDRSDGDGIKERLPFNSKKYTENYIKFIEHIYKYNPNTKVVLLNSPMIQGERNDTLVSCLKNVQSYFKINQNKDIKVFEFDSLYINGCNYHPSIEDNKVMAEKLIPFFKEILNTL